MKRIVPALGCRGLGVFAALLLALVASLGRAAETMPPPPRDHFNDYAGIVSRDIATQLNQELTQFERDTSNQIVVAIFPKLESSSSIEDYTVRVFQAWGVGQKDRKNGAVLFVFRDDRKLRIVTGYGLEGALPDALAKQIIENEITPLFRAGDFSGGIAAGTHAIIAAVKGEYRGTGATVADRSRGTGGTPFGSLLPFGIGLLILFSFIRRLFGRRNVVYGRYGRRGVWVNNTPWWGGGGSGGSSGGSFSGGGGSSGGGGAGGSW
ncbi:MAG: TPM domain-containing protein [Opitutaceae bacterium]